MRTTWAAVVLVAVGLGGAPSPARGDWPIRRHDAARTALADRPSELLLETPAVRWRYYLGGSVRAGNVLTFDVDGDGLREMAFLSGGKIVAKRPDDSLVWETPSLSLDRLDAFTDLNGDGSPEIVASGFGGVLVVVSTATGEVRWQAPAGTFGPRIGAVRVGRLDGRPFLYAADSGAATPGSLGDVAHAWQLAADFTATRLWSLERGREHDSGIHDVVADLDGDGTSEVLAFSETVTYLYDGRTGAKVRLAGAADPDGGYPLTTPGGAAFRNPLGLAQTMVADVDGDGDREVIGLSSHVYDMGTRTIFVLDHSTTGPRLTVRWHHAFARDGVHELDAAAVLDLDRDGSLELLTSYAPTGGTSTTFVFAAATGAMRASLPGRLAAVHPTELGAAAVVLLRNGPTLDGYTFGGAIAPVEPAFRLPTAADPAPTTHLARREEATLARSFVTFPLATGGRGIVLLGDGVAELWDPARPDAAVLRHELPPGTQPASATSGDDVARPGERLLVSRTDGYLIVLDEAFRPIAFGDPDRPETGIRTGGYYAGASWPDQTAVAGRMRAAPAPDEIVVRSSVGDVLRLDASAATLFTPPEEVWRCTGGVTFPSLAHFDDDGLLDVVAIREGHVVIRRGDAGGGPADLFDLPVLTGSQTLVGDALPIRYRDTTRVVVEVSDTVAAAVPLKILVPGSPPDTWITTPRLAAYSYFSADDLDDDGEDEILAGSYSVYGSDGRLLEGPNVENSVGIASRVGDGTGPVTHVSAGSVQPVTGVSIARTSPFEMAQRWQLEPGGVDVDTYSQQGVAIQCGARWVFVTPRFGSSELWLIEVADGTGRAVLVGGGRIFAPGDPAFAGVRSGPLTSVIGSAELSAGRPGVVFGSGDGHLYLVDPCPAPPALPELRHALDLRAPVGEAILADTDGDGLDEIVVGAADGWLYGIDREAFPAPASVIDVDPITMDLAIDVDESRGPALLATWAEVAGATEYEWRVYTAGGTEVTRTPGRVLAAEPRLARFDMPLSVGARYFFAVRAIGPGGASSEAVSDGTLYLGSAPPPDGGIRDAATGGDSGAGDGGRRVPPGDDGGCSCRSPGEGGRAAWPLAAIAAIALIAVLRLRARR